MDGLCRATFGLHFVAVYAVEEGAGRVATIGVLIAQRCAVILGIPAFAGDHAGMAADAGVEVNHEAKLALGGLW